MRVGLVIYGSLDKLTGGYLYDRMLATYLQEHGDPVEVISMPWSWYPRHLLHNVSSRFFQRLMELKVDVLLEDELNHPSLFMLNRRLQGRVAYPIVSITHHARCCELHPAWHNVVYRQIERWYLSGVDGYIFNSETTHLTVEELLSRSCAQQKRSLIARPGRDRLHARITDAEIRRRVQDETLRLLFVGSVIPRKGLHHLIHALTQLSDDRWTLSVIGDMQAEPAYARRLLRQLARSKLAGRVSLEGAVSDAVISRHLSANHLLVIPSSYEGYGITYAEGMGYGLPAVGAIDGGAREVITHRENGFLVLPGDITSLKRYIEELINDRALLLQMSLNARRHYESLPTWEDSMQKIRLFLATLAHDKYRSCEVAASQ